MVLAAEDMPQRKQNIGQRDETSMATRHGQNDSIAKCGQIKAETKDLSKARFSLPCSVQAIQQRRLTSIKECTTTNKLLTKEQGDRDDLCSHRGRHR